MSNCELCGEPMPPGEEMFKYHGYSGPCPKSGKQISSDLIPKPKYTDEEIRSWAFMTERGGSFIRAFGTAILHADMSNFALLRNVAEQMIDKFPQYLIKRDIRSGK